MPIRKLPNRLTWRGPKTVAEVAHRLAQRKPLVLSLPWSFHHALTVRLCDHARLHGMLDVGGGPDLLSRLAEIDGLQELAQLREPVRVAGASVRVQSPPPQVQVFFPPPGSRRAWRAGSRHRPCVDATHLAAQPPAAIVDP